MQDLTTPPEPAVGSQVDRHVGPQAAAQPRLTVRLQSFPESNGKRNWTALLVRVDAWGGLVGNCGGITIDRGECWNRVAYEAERAKLLIGERDTEPDIMDYGDDIRTPEEWAGEVRGGRITFELSRARRYSVATRLERGVRALVPKRDHVCTPEGVDWLCNAAIH